VITIGAGAAFLFALVVWIALSVRLPTSTDFSSAPDAARYVMEMLHAGPMPWLLALPKLALAPYFATGPRDFALALIPALILLAVHYSWVIYTEVAFEEASIARAEKRAARRRASQQGDWRGNVRSREGANTGIRTRQHRPAGARISVEKPARDQRVLPPSTRAGAHGHRCRCHFVAFAAAGSRSDTRSVVGRRPGHSQHERTARSAVSLDRTCARISPMPTF